MQIDLYDMDKNGVALGNLVVIGPNGEKIFYAVDLVSPRAAGQAHEKPSAW
jgi:hypothetical protein